MVLLDNGISEFYENGEKFILDFKWSIINNELHVKYMGFYLFVWKLNPDNSITHIADIIDGKRKDRAKEQQTLTLKKIK